MFLFDKIMSFYLQQKLQQKNNKREKYDNNMKAKKLKHIFYLFSVKKKFDKKKQCLVLFSDICTVSDEAFGRLTIERCWDTWTNECEYIQIQHNAKALSV